MPVYNSVDTVKKSIVSFKKLSEISNFNCRLFIVDDCSTDQSNIMIDEIIKSNENIDLIQNKKNFHAEVSVVLFVIISVDMITCANIISLAYSPE